MKTTYLLAGLLLLSSSLWADVRLPHLFTDHMVLQRDREIRIWGWGDARERVTVQFSGQTVKTRATKDGTWSVTLAAMPASATSQTLTVIGKNTLSLEDVLVGDVWICSGQSNMEWAVGKSNNPDEEIAAAKFPLIRLLNVERHATFQPQEDIPQTLWKPAIGENLRPFSAVGYFFGRHIHQSQNIPIGLISTNWGGTRAESWTSAEALAPFDHTQEALAKMATMDMSYDEYAQFGSEQVRAWVDKHYPKEDVGMDETWFAEGHDFSNWETYMVPSEIENLPGMAGFDGIIWLKRAFQMPASLEGIPLFLRLGSVNNLDEVYINGQKIAETINPKAWRSYRIPPEVLKPGKENIVVLRVFNYAKEGGLLEVNVPKIGISLEQWDITPRDISLAGEWKYKASTKLGQPITEAVPKAIRASPNAFPSCLYNGMVHPLLNFPIKGAIWYQGESNTKTFDDAILYRDVFANMINNWRNLWGYDFPFYWVQLANYSARQPTCDDPCEQVWPYLRESQQLALQLPQTGTAVTIDVGNPTDIHPRDKQTVGKRLGLLAEAGTYGKEVVYSGPEYRSLEVKGNEAWLSFDHVGSGLKANGRHGYLFGFQVAGSDKKFHWAQARIEGSKVVVVSEKVTKPMSVRYGWENNPEAANLYNKEGLPASPFRTDDWTLFE